MANKRKKPLKTGKSVLYTLTDRTPQCVIDALNQINQNNDYTLTEYLTALLIQNVFENNPELELEFSDIMKITNNKYFSQNILNQKHKSIFAKAMVEAGIVPSQNVDASVDNPKDDDKRDELADDQDKDNGQDDAPADDQDKDNGQDDAPADDQDKDNGQDDAPADDQDKDNGQDDAPADDQNKDNGQDDTQGYEDKKDVPSKPAKIVGVVGKIENTGNMEIKGKRRGFF